MKRFALASFIVVLLAGFWMFPYSSGAQIFQSSSLFSFNVPATTSGSTSVWSTPISNWSASSSLSSLTTNTSSSLGLNLTSSWASAPFSTNSSNLSSNFSLYPAASYLPVASPISQLSLGNQFLLGNQFSYNNQFSYGNQFSSQPSLYPTSLYPTSLYPSRSSNSLSFFPSLSPFSGLFPGTSSSFSQFPKVVKLSYRVESDKAGYGSAQPVRISFTITNSDSAPVSLNFNSGKQFDAIAKNSAGAKVWQLSSHMFYTMALSTIKLNAGESKKLQGTWDQKDDKGVQVPGGSYTIEAFLTSTDQNYGQTSSTKISITALVTGEESLPKFSSCTKLRQKLDEISKAANSGPYFGYAMYAMESMDAPGLRVATSAAPTAPAALGGSMNADDYSTTNVQVAGVDEADRIKNDGSHIYLIKGQSVRIIKAYPANTMQELPKIDYEGSTFNPSQLYVDGDTLIVIGNDYEAPVQESAGPVEVAGFMAPSMRVAAYHPYIPRSSLTRVIIYDITNRAKVKEQRNLKFEGDYLQSRRVDDTLYVIMNQYPQYVPVDNPPVPLVTAETMVPKYHDSTRYSSTDKADKAICDCDEVSYFPGSTESRYLIVVAIPFNNPAGEIGKEVVLGSSENVYSSLSNLFVAHTNYTNDEGETFSYYSSNPKTQVYKFSFDNENIQYAGKGQVSGTIINQFAMDEYDNYFRIATTKGQAWDEQNSSSNNLYVLNDQMEQVGSIEKIAPGESIKSVRFMGDKAYMVTFLQVDPLFVISLKNPARPEILGQLKIPGYSDYLHPYDENHLIGFGKEVDASIDADKVHSANAVYYTAVLGMKISLFDVTDVAHPRELFKEVIGYRNTESDLLNDHKALLFSKEKNLMAFPITVTEQLEDTTDEYNNYEYTFQGAYFYHLDLTSGFTKKAAITHYDTSEEFLKAGYNFYGGENNIRRIIYIGHHFYTISDGKIKAVDMQTYKEDKVIILEGSPDDSYSQPYPGDRIILFKGE